MISFRLRTVLSILLVAAALSACAGPTPSAPLATEPLPTEPPMTEPPATEPPTLEPTVMTPAPPSFEAETYRDETSGFEFDYPAGWFVGPMEQQPRGGILAFTSWERPTDELPGETPPGETRMDATVQLWDPHNDLEAFIAQRVTAWEASGNVVQAQEEWTLSDGRPARAFIVTATDGSEAYFFFTTIGPDYLVLSGSGDLELLAEIAHAVRPLTTP